MAASNHSLTWGVYLCRGAMDAKAYPNIIDNDDGDDATVKHLISRLESGLRKIGLSKFSSSVAVQFISSKLQSGHHSKVQHAVQYLLNLVSNNLHPKEDDISMKHKCRLESTHKCPQIIPGLKADPFWDRASLPWVQTLETAFPEIKREFFALQQRVETHGGNSGFQHYRSPKGDGLSSTRDTSMGSNQPTKTSSPKLEPQPLGVEATDSGHWNVCYFYLHGMDFSENLARCPCTANAIASIPRQYHHAMFSALAPSTHITPHCGPTNKKLRCHLPIHVPSSSVDNQQVMTGSWIRVGDQFHTLEEGKCFVFDDSFEHEASNTSSLQPRIVLIVDVWHPDLSDEEVKFFDFINRAQVKAAKVLSKELQARREGVGSGSISRPQVGGTHSGREGGEEDYSNREDFYHIIESAKAAGIDFTIDRDRIWPSEVPAGIAASAEPSSTT
mmetsp:Transcript_4086/g.6492  ORF Transcript_4086/g.6492 Transcript_4086/m.6492 type:complete len:444 (-) Transcript_4086:10-1341(-)